MRISKVTIKNYRSIKSLTLDIDDYTVLIGPNGSGKSSVLYALNWFFNGGSLDELDRHRDAGSEIEEREDDNREPIEVDVTFAEIDDADRRVLRSYARGDSARFRRVWPDEDGKEKMLGNSWIGPGFDEVKSAEPADAVKAAYRELRKQVPDLPDVSTKKAVFEELRKWESNPANEDRLVETNTSDATHMFGFQGEHVLAKRMRYVLVPAAADIADQVGSTGRGSALSELVGSILAAATGEAKESWQRDHEDELGKLRTAIRESVASATDAQAARVNAGLEQLLPNASVKFEASLPEVSFGGTPDLRTSVDLDGVVHDVGRQGHGVQRAVMMALLQALIPDGGVGEDDGDPQGADGAPALMVAIEEPEIYQHPIRARSFARVLAKVSDGGGRQICLATHCPYFILPEQFEALRQIRLADGHTVSMRTGASKVAMACDRDESDVRRRLQLELPRTFSEGFFADTAVLVEGETDKVVIESIAALLGKPLDAEGIAVLSLDGKENLRLGSSLLEELGTPVFVVVDGDAEQAQRKHPNDPDKEERARASHKAQTDRVLEWLPDVTARVGKVPCVFGGVTTVTDRYWFLHDDLESELEGWQTFLTAFEQRNTALRSKDVASYRAAVSEADVNDIPEVFKTAILAIIERKAGT